MGGRGGPAKLTKVKPGGGAGGLPGGGVGPTGGTGTTGGITGGRTGVPGTGGSAGGGPMAGYPGNPGPQGQGAPGSATAQKTADRFDRQNGRLTRQYRDQLEKKFDTGTQDAKDVYDRFIPNGGAVSNGTLRDGAWYRPFQDDIEMNFRADSSGYSGKEPGTTWFHEHGHYVDAHAMYPSQDYGFYSAIRADIEDSENRWLSAHGYTRADVGVRITERDMRLGVGREISRKGANTHAVQDVYGGVFIDYNAQELSKSGVYNSARWGHSWFEYWTRGNQAFEVTSESWAHMFNAEFSVAEAQAMRDYLPRAYAYFQNRLRGIK